MTHHFGQQLTLMLLCGTWWSLHTGLNRAWNGYAYVKREEKSRFVKFGILNVNETCHGQSLQKNGPTSCVGKSINGASAGYGWYHNQEESCLTKRMIQ
jgi:hypothetical protein